MFNRSTIDCERRSLEKLKKYQLPHSVKKYGVAITIICFILLIAIRLSINQPELKLLTKYGMLIGLLLVSISRDQVEDELMTHLRMQSYTLAFIAGIVLTLIQPFISYGIDYFLDPSAAVFEEIGDFQILWILLCIQVFYFEMLKYLYK